MKCDQSRLGFELVSPCPFPTTITITPRAPLSFLHHSPIDSAGMTNRYLFFFTQLITHNALHSPIRSHLSLPLSFLNCYTMPASITQPHSQFWHVSRYFFDHTILWWGSSLEFWGMWSTTSLLLLLGSFWPRVILFVRISSMDQIELFNVLLGIFISYLNPYCRVSPLIL